MGWKNWISVRDRSNYLNIIEHKYVKEVRFNQEEGLKKLHILTNVF